MRDCKIRFETKIKGREIERRREREKEREREREREKEGKGVRVMFHKHRIYRHAQLPIFNIRKTW